MQQPFVLGGRSIPPGSRRCIDLPVSVLSDHTPVTLSAEVVHGKRPGPVMFVSAMIHGDEVIGVEIVRRLLRAAPVQRLSGTLIAVPIVNAFGFLNQSRYLPDRRDLNRCFPGHSEGSLAGRLAHLFRTEIVERCDVGIDLHSAAQGRTNLPQIRLTPGNERLRALGDAFAAPVTLMSKVRDGSLREAASAAGVDLLLYEAGEGLRFDEFAARAGLAGILRVMAHLGMIGAKGVPRARGAPVFCERSGWTRAPSGGLLRTLKASGDFVEKGAVLGVISDPFGTVDAEVQATETGIIVGRTNLPVVNEGDALFHIAVPRRIAHAEAAAQGMGEHLEAAPLFDEDEII
ncbi:succinylglutamate desuccinylase [Thalassococcus profundi]|uniref:Succinylglutamate desuccinylase n=1 Tax=Thalassococcus profundi TaxID=2282382 RepID=A0A369TP72_9RHOB|nr:succinylglutamate desuccinylase/aspartoacylase family protein [Thalassococcus profundi]RDD66245.1 succinylglutamate desuccinylase [Thalassococcus profundi]